MARDPLGTMLRITVPSLLLLGLFSHIHCSQRPRMEYSNTDIPIRSIRFPKRVTQEQVQLVLEGNNSVIVNAGQRLYVFYFHPDVNQTHHVLKSRCESTREEDKSCNITVLHKRRGTNQVFVCATIKAETSCCNMELSPSAECTLSSSLKEIEKSIHPYQLKAGEPSIFIESPENEELFVTQSSTENSIGIYKFGLNQVRPTMPENAFSVEHQYKGLVASRSKQKDKTQEKLYAFFKEKNTAMELESDAWLPFVAQVCMADKGGIKTKLLYQWTSQLKARLFCGDKANRRHYAELVDVAFHHEEDGEVSKVYALFQNEWRMSAVCVYSIETIQKVFSTSAFKENKKDIPDPRPGTCTQDKEIKWLSFVQNHPEMEDRVFSMDDQPLLVSQHHYTHILLDVVHPHTLLYLSLQSGSIHKFLDSKTGAFPMAEYSPFSRRTHILAMTLHAPKRKLYVSSSEEVVQMYVENCATYGQHCVDCVLARDPYCGWNGTHCVSATSDTLQDVEKGNPDICQSGKVYGILSRTMVWNDQSHHTQDSPPSRFVLHCPVSSRHAEYTWHHPGTNTTTTCSTAEPQCVLLVDGHNQGGVYRCTALEQGYTKDRAIVHMQVEKSGTPLASPMPWAWIGVAVLLVRVLG